MPTEERKTLTLPKKTAFTSEELRLKPEDCAVSSETANAIGVAIDRAEFLALQDTIHALKPRDGSEIVPQKPKPARPHGR